MDSNSMRNTIHPTAILEGNIEMGDGNTIGPHVVIQGNVSLGNNNSIQSGTTIVNNVIIGDDNVFYPYTSIGALGEMGAKGDRLVPEGKVWIGNKVTLREFVCVHSPVMTQETRIEDQVYLMNKSYVAHDVMIGKGVVLNAGVMLAGRVTIEAWATIGMGAAVHQRLTIGTSCMIGMQTPVTRNILPFAKVVGNPSRILGFNSIAAERLGIDQKWITEMEKIFSKDVVVNDDSDNPLMQKVSAFLQHHPGSLVHHKY